MDKGSGSTLLLLHGNPAWSFLYRKIIAALTDEYRCVVPDFPGYGMSTAAPGYGLTAREHSQILEWFVERIGLTDLMIMVQDWGGPLGSVMLSPTWTDRGSAAAEGPPRLSPVIRSAAPPAHQC